MRRLAVLLAVLLLPACYQVEGDGPPAAAAVRVEGVKDGLYRRPDGAEVVVRWNLAQRRYDVAAKADPAQVPGNASALPIGGRLYLVRYADLAQLALLASVDGDDVVLYVPSKAAEQRLLKAHGLSLRPGPINGLTGPGSEVEPYFRDLVASGELSEGGRLTYLGPAG